VQECGALRGPGLQHGLSVFSPRLENKHLRDSLVFRPRAESGGSYSQNVPRADDRARMNQLAVQTLNERQLFRLGPSQSCKLLTCLNMLNVINGTVFKRFRCHSGSLLHRREREREVLPHCELLMH
jgi:hypothetical protein